MSKHTPGPWEYLGCVTTEDNDTVEWPTVVVAPKRYIKPDGRSFEEAEANARLIESAPDMYELIRLLAESTKKDYAPSVAGAKKVHALHQLQEAAEKLLAKIEGGGDE